MSKTNRRAAAAAATNLDTIPAPTLDEIRRWPATIGVPQAAPALNVSPSHLRALIVRGEAPVKVLKLGRRYAVITASLIRLLSGEREAA